MINVSARLATQYRETAAKIFHILTYLDLGPPVPHILRQCQFKITTHIY